MYMRFMYIYIMYIHLCLSKHNVRVHMCTYQFIRTYVCSFVYIDRFVHFKRETIIAEIYIKARRYPLQYFNIDYYKLMI